MSVILLLAGTDTVARGGTFDVTGTAVTLRVGHKLAIGAGSYTWTGTAATLTQGQAGPSNPLDTKAKRSSAINWGLPAGRTLPETTGGDQAARQHNAFSYSGILAQTVAAQAGDATKMGYLTYQAVIVSAGA